LPPWRPFRSKTAISKRAGAEHFDLSDRLASVKASKHLLAFARLGLEAERPQLHNSGSEGRNLSVSEALRAGDLDNELFEPRRLVLSGGHRYSKLGQPL